MLTVGETLHNMVHSTLDATDGLVVEDSHLSAHSDRVACQRQQSHVDVLLPEVAYQVDRTKHTEQLEVGFNLGIRCIRP